MVNLKIFFLSITIGLIIGLSESPIISNVITSLLTILITFVTLFSNLKEEIPLSDKLRIINLVLKKSLSPTFSIILGIFMGGCIGLFQKNYDFININQNNNKIVTIESNATKLADIIDKAEGTKKDLLWMYAKSNIDKIDDDPKEFQYFLHEEVEIPK